MWGIKAAATFHYSFDEVETTLLKLFSGKAEVWLGSGPIPRAP